MTARRKQAIRGAYLLAAKAVRKEVKNLSALAAGGVAVDEAQHGTLSSIAEQLHLLGIASEDPPERLKLVEGTP